MTKAVLFDLGNTLAEYYESCAYPELLQLCIREAAEFATRSALPPVADETLWRRVEEENREEADHRVRPLEDRLLSIFGLDPRELPPGTVAGLCRAFMKPIFGLGRCYEDSVPTLLSLRAAGVRVGIVSNAPWGCPSPLCREERGGSGSSNSRTRSPSART
jgi:FMN phosphatase YigB (HAD superfamily)